MNPIVLKIVSEAGWYEGRKIDVSYFLQEYINCGFPPPNDVILKIMEEFWNIRIEFYHPDGWYFDIKLLLDDAFNNTDENDVELMSKKINEAIIPVGVLADDYFCLWISFSGKFYMSEQDKLYHLADNFWEAMEFIYNRGDFHSREVV